MKAPLSGFFAQPFPRGIVKVSLMAGGYAVVNWRKAKKLVRKREAIWLPGIHGRWYLTGKGKWFLDMAEKAISAMPPEKPWIPVPVWDDYQESSINQLIQRATKAEP